MLVGRDRELSEMGGALARLRSGGGALFLIAGEPGIGKTRLAAEVASIARQSGVRTAWGRCWESGGAPAYWPWREAFEAFALTFPEASTIAATEPAEARFALFREVGRTLGAASPPLLIILEDLHAADHSTLMLLELMAGSLGNMPVLLIGTHRDPEAALSPHVEALARLARAGRVLQLPRLAPADVATLVRDAIQGSDERLAASVFEATQGHPLFVDEVVRDIRAHGERRGLPLGVREAIRQRLSPLSPGVRALLEGCAVLGVELAAAVALRMVPEGETWLDDATASGVLVANGDRLRFSHALYREAIYRELPLARRRTLHREAARAIAATGASLAEITHHLIEGGPETATQAVDHAVRAAALAVDGFAFEDALALLQRARASIPPGPDEAALCCKIDIALGETRLRAGDPSGRATCAEAAATARALGDPGLLARAGLAYGAVFLTGGVDPVLVAMLEEGLAGLPETDSPLRARVMARLAAARQPSPPEARGRDVALGLEAIAMGRRVASPRELLGVLHAASGVLYGKVHPAIRIPISREQERLAEQLGDTVHLLHARIRLAYDHLEQADFAAYGELAASYEELARRIGSAAEPWRVPLMRSAIALAADAFAESERWQEQARRLGSGPRARRAVTFHRLGFCRAAERHAELRAAIPELRGLWLAMPYGPMLADARVASVLARIGAVDELEPLLAAMPDAAVDEEINASVLADAAWATGDARLAARLLPLLSELGDRWHAYWFDCEIADAPSARARALVAGVLDRWDECDRLHARARAEVEAVGRRSLVARMDFELGDLLVRKGRSSERGRTLVLAARTAAAAIGLPELVELIDRRHPTLAAEPGRSQRRGFGMAREGEYWALPGTRGTLRFKTSRGMEYLARLVDRPGEDIHVLELVGSMDHPDRGDAGELVDTVAFRAYRARLEALREHAETAETLGDAGGAARAREEMQAIAAELARATGKGGRARRGESAVDRARSAVQRRIKDALDRIADQDPELGARLRRAVRTGNTCRYRPVD